MMCYFAKTYLQSMIAMTCPSVISFDVVSFHDDFAASSSCILIACGAKIDAGGDETQALNQIC